MSSDYSPPDPPDYDPDAVAAVESVAASLRARMAWQSLAFPDAPAYTVTGATEAQIMEDLEAVLREQNQQPHGQPIQTHCAPAVLLGQDEHERAKMWGHMLADLPSASPLTDHGCKLVNFLARQEARRMQTAHRHRKDFDSLGNDK